MSASPAVLPTSAKVLVTGGSGFIGSQVCRLAVEEGLTVVSLSRSGRPMRQEGWTDKVTWAAADVFNPSTWHHHLADCEAVVHCIGIAWERPNDQVTFERLNGDSAIIVANTAHAQGVRRFILISAAGNIPFTSPRYLSAKRRAEAHIRGLSFRHAILRPNLVYGPTRTLSIVGGKLQEAAQRLPVLGPLAQAARPPIHVHQLAAAGVFLATQSDEQGIFGIRDIVNLAHRFDPQLDLDEAATLKALLVTGALVGVGVGLWMATRNRGNQ